MDIDIKEVDGKELESFVLSIEQLESEKGELIMQIKDIYDEAKAQGLDTKTLRMVVRMRRLKVDVMKSQKQLLNDYLDALEKNK